MRKTKEIQRHNQHIRPIHGQQSSLSKLKSTSLTVLTEKREDNRKQLRTSKRHTITSFNTTIAKKHNFKFKDANKAPHVYKQKFIPLQPVIEQKQHSHKRSDSSFSNVTSSFLPELSPTISNEMKFTDNDWKEGDHCQVFIKSKQEWLGAKICRVFDYDEERWVRVQCHNNNIQLELHIIDENIRMHFDENIRMHRSTLQIELVADDMSSFLQSVCQVVELINRGIDSTLNFLYQIYYIDVTDFQTTKSFITYDHVEAMTRYKRAVANKHSTSMLCNGHVLKEYGLSTYYQMSTEQAKNDYDMIDQCLHREKLDKQNIVNNWQRNSHKYNQKWLLSVKKEEFVSDFMEQFGGDIVQNAIKLYDKLITIIKFGEQESKTDEKSIHLKSTFLWNPGKLVKSLDHLHFLYLVSVVLDEIKPNFQHVDTRQILLCLHNMEMTGLMFSKIGKNAFTGSIVVDSHSFKEIKIDVLKQIVDCANKLYEHIHDFNLESIQASSVCSLYLSNSDELDDEKNEEKNQKDIANEAKLDFWVKWDTTVQTQYSQNTRFNTRLFDPWINLYKDDPKVMISFQYDNYSAAMTQKTYQHVLKSFLAWFVKLRCSDSACDEKLKLCCFCDINTFQLYTYNIIMGIIELRANNDDTLLKKLVKT
eukprot:482500_1